MTVGGADLQKLHEYFAQTPLLGTLCRQNGWPDSDSLRVEVRVSEEAILCSVQFDEILMEGSGCVAGRVERWGQFRVTLDESGGVTQAEPH